MEVIPTIKAPDTIAKRIRLIRLAKEMTQKELSKATGINRVTIAKYETGKLLPTSGALVALAEALDCRVDEILIKDQLKIG